MRGKDQCSVGIQVINAFVQIKIGVKIYGISRLLEPVDHPELSPPLMLACIMIRTVASAQIEHIRIWTMVGKNPTSSVRHTVPGIAAPPVVAVPGCQVYDE